MNALIDLEHCRESMTISLNDVDHTVRLAGTIEEPYFCGKDICDVLRYKDSKKALQNNVQSKYKKELSYFNGSNDPKDAGESFSPASLGSFEPLTFREGMAIYVNEPGLYALIMNSKTPFATTFQELVLETVLPSIRRYGSYQAEMRLTETMAQLAIRDQSYEEECEARQRAEEERQRAEEERQRAEVRLEEEKQRAEEFRDQIKTNEKYTLVLKNLMIDDRQREKTQVVYISTSRNYANQNRFKVGGVESVAKLTPRLSAYNGRSASGDEWYFSDVFLVADYRQIETRLKDLIGTFRDKKGKEIYVLHYTNINYVVRYLCEHYNDEVDEVNSKLAEFISNLHPHNLRPIVPEPYTANFANITTLKENGTVTNTTLQAKSEKDFSAQLAKYILTLDSTTTQISKKKVFDDLKVKIGRNKKFPMLVQFFGQFRPDIKIIFKE